MAGSIPLRRTGLVIFSSRIVSIFTGMLFLIMVTGWLSSSRFGLWEVILTFVAVASYPAGFLGFWATREIARGRLLGRTVILMNLGLSAISALAYLLVSRFTFAVFTPQYGPFLVALLLIPLAYVGQAANSVAGGHKPSALGYSLLISEPAKLVVAYVALFVLKLEIYGVIAAVLASYVIQAAVTTLLVADTLVERTDLGVGRVWARNSWVPAIYSFPTSFAAIDTVVASALASTSLAGHYQAAFQIGTLVYYVFYLSYALYPLLLKGGSDEVPNASLDLILMFGVPMVVGVAALAPHLLTVLNPVYVAPGGNMTVPLAILATAGLVTAISGFMDNALIAKDRSDLQMDRSFGSYLKSSFAFVSKVNIAYALSYISLVAAEIYFGGRAGLSVTTLVTGWSLLQLGLLSFALAVKLKRVLGEIRLGFPRPLPKYLLCSLLMGVVVFLLAEVVLGADTGRFAYGLKTIGVVAVGAAVYFGSLAAIDPAVRRLASSMFRRRRPGVTPPVIGRG